MSSVTEAITFGLGEQGDAVASSSFGLKNAIDFLFQLATYLRDQSQQEEEAAKFQRDLAEIYKRKPSSYQGHGWSAKEMKRHCDYLAKAALKASAKLSRVADYQEWIAEQMREHPNQGHGGNR